MNDQWLIFDMPYMCYRAFFSTGGLSYKEGPTGVIYGVLKSIQHMQNQFLTDKLMFCFDHGKSWRKHLYPDYKKNRRKNMTKEQEQAYDEMKVQVNQLKYRYLYEIGYRNIFYQKGFEADDIIAALPLIHKLNAIIVTADKDLFQCITETPRVVVYNPFKDQTMDAKLFRRTYGVLPSQWAWVKAIAGCPSDCIPGVKGVGEKTAIKYITNNLTGAKANAIDAHKQSIQQTLVLTGLPYNDGVHCLNVNQLQIEKDEVSLKAWRQVTSSLGMKSLENSMEVRDGEEE